MPSGVMDKQAHTKVDAVYRAESRRVFATLIRVLGDFDLAEEAMHDAFTSAVEQWPRDGVPENPRAWLVTAGRFKAIDAMRRRARHDASLAEIAERPDEIDAARAKQSRDQLEKQINAWSGSEEDLALAKTELDRSVVRMQLASR